MTGGDGKTQDGAAIARRKGSDLAENEEADLQ
jgi:hypothetical protein